MTRRSLSVTKSIAFSEKQECIPVGCILPTAVAIWGASQPGTPRTGPQPPGIGILSEQALPRSRHRPQNRHQAPRDQTAPGEQAPPCGQTHACKHIILPQTSFADGKYDCLWTLIMSSETSHFRRGNSFRIRFHSV